MLKHVQRAAEEIFGNSAGEHNGRAEVPLMKGRKIERMELDDSQQRQVRSISSLKSIFLFVISINLLY